MDRESGSEAGSGRGTPRSIDQENLRCDTPGPMPTYTYSAVSTVHVLVKKVCSFIRCIVQILVLKTIDP